MKKNQKIIVGVGIAVLLYFLWSKSKKKQPVSQPAITDSTDTKNDSGTTTGTGDATDDGTTTGTTTVTETKLDTSGIPKECINGFELNGKKYFIKDNKFQKQ